MAPQITASQEIFATSLLVQEKILPICKKSTEIKST